MRDARERAIHALHELPPTTTPRALFAQLGVSARVGSTILARLRQEGLVVGSQRRITLATRADSRDDRGSPMRPAAPRRPQAQRATVPRASAPPAAPPTPVRRTVERPQPTVRTAAERTPLETFAELVAAPTTTPIGLPGLAAPRALPAVAGLLGLSQRQLSQPGVSYAYISRLEAGTRTPSVKALRLLAPTLNVSVEWLETGQETSRFAKFDDAELRLLAQALRSCESEGASELLTELRLERSGRRAS